MLLTNNIVVDVVLQSDLIVDIYNSGQGDRILLIMLEGLFILISVAKVF